TQDNRGIGAARNRGIGDAAGKYVALLDHDDIWMPDKLDVQYRYYEKHPECSVVSIPYAYSTKPNHCVVNPRAVAGEDGIIHLPMGALARGDVFLMSSSIMFARVKA